MPATNLMSGPKLHAAGAPTTCRPGKDVSIKPGDDPRSRIVAITAPGRGIVRRGFPYWSKAQAHVGKMLGGDGQAALKTLTSRSLG